MEVFVDLTEWRTVKDSEDLYKASAEEGTVKRQRTRVLDDNIFAESTNSRACPPLYFLK